jgi:hypothetical protein
MVAANTGIPIIEQNYIVPISTGRTTAVSGIGTSSTTAIGADSQRREITFHNPNQTVQQNLYVCQAQDAANNALAATVDGAGTFIIYPGSSLSFKGNVGGAWTVCAAAAAAKLTIITDNAQ